MRVFGAAPEHIFTASAAGDVVSVDLFEASTISVARADGVALTVTVATDWPFATRADILVSASAPAALTLHVRVPSWVQPPGGAAANVTILLDGVAVASSAPGTYAVLPLSAGAAEGEKTVTGLERNGCGPVTLKERPRGPKGRPPSVASEVKQCARSPREAKS